MSNSNNSGEKFWAFIIVGACIIAGMWLLEIGPFEKSYTPTPTYYNNYGGGSQPSFTGSSSKVFSRSVKFYNIDGSSCYGTYDLQTDGTYEYYNGSKAQCPLNSDFNYFVSFGGGFAYFN